MLLSPLPPFFLTCIICLWDVRPYTSSLAFLFPGSFVGVLLSFISWMVPSILQGKLPRCLSLWWDSCSKAWFREVFSFVWDTLFKNLFFQLHLYDSVLFHYSWCTGGLAFVSVYNKTAKAINKKLWCNENCLSDILLLLLLLLLLFNLCRHKDVISLLRQKTFQHVASFSSITKELLL